MEMDKGFRQVAAGTRKAKVVLSGMSVGTLGASITFKLRDESARDGKAYKSIVFDAKEWAAFKAAIERGAIDVENIIGK